MKTESSNKRYMYWSVLDEMPEGWIIDKTAGSPLARSVFITNGKSPISGQQKRAILRIKNSGRNEQQARN
ncbi:MAG: hypothetical protein ACRC9P_01880 [Bacteroides sp.]